MCQTRECCLWLKARTYLEKQDWVNAEKYAKLAQQGYAMMSETDYLSRDNGFNTPNSSWMFATKFVSSDINISDNDGDCSWGSVMLPENGSAVVMLLTMEV